MQVIEPGHVYELHQLDLPQGLPYEPLRLKFVNREPGTEHPGTQTQEVLRALIDRTMHCDNCLRWPGNDLIIYHLRMALVLHEARALERKVEKGYMQPENVDTLLTDGHFDLPQLSPGTVDGHKYAAKEKKDSPLVPKMPVFCVPEKKLTTLEAAAVIVDKLAELRPETREHL